MEIQISAVICDQLIALEFDWLARLGAFARDFNEKNGGNLANTK